MLVRPSQSFVEVDAACGRAGVALTYLVQRVEHILFGFDHLLFVASLLLVVSGWRMAVKTITAFTVAHSITLALATFGLVNLPPGPVAILIAGSIVLVAVEAARRERGETSATVRWPFIVAFAFGLLHGFGFAGALRSLGLPEADIPLALLTFNIGVELGQLAFVALALLAIAAARVLLPIPSHARLAATYVIGVTATLWVFERLSATFA